MIIDTDVLIWELRGSLKAREIIHQNIPFGISVVTYIELVQGMRNKQELNKFIMQLTRWNVNIIQINPDISTRAMIFIEEFFLSHSLELADALIAATALEHNLTLLTGNTRHFAVAETLKIERFEP